MQKILTSNPPVNIELRTVDTRPTNEGFFRVFEYFYAKKGATMIDCYDLAVDYFVHKQMSLAFSNYQSFKRSYYYHKSKN